MYRNDRAREPFGERRGLLAVLLLALLCITSVLAYGVRRQMPDDAYIYLRVAQNVISVHQWAFNPGIPVNAATSPLYGVFLAAIVALPLPGIETALVVAAALGLFALAAAIFQGTRHLGAPTAFLLALVGSTFPTLLRSEGLETPMYLALIAGTALAVQGGNEYMVGIVAGLTALGRPEGVAMVVLALAAQWLRSRRLPWRAAMLSAIPMAIWLAYCLHTFHTVIPHTMKIKAMQSAVHFWGGSWFAEFLTQVPGYKILFFFSLLGLVAAGREFRRFPSLFLVILFGIVQTAGYTLLRAPAGYFWYDAPGVLAYYLSTVLGLLVAFRLLLDRVPHPRWAVAALPVALIIGYLGPEVVWERTHSTPYRVSSDYIAAAAWLRANSAPGDWVAADEIGYLSIYSQRSVRDMLGLADPGSLLALSQHRWDFWLTDDPQPRFILVHQPRWVGEPGFAGTPWSAAALNTFGTEYRPVYQAGVVQVMEHE